MGEATLQLPLQFVPVSFDLEAEHLLCNKSNPSLCKICKDFLQVFIAPLVVKFQIFKYPCGFLSFLELFFNSFKNCKYSKLLCNFKELPRLFQDILTFLSDVGVYVLVKFNFLCVIKIQLLLPF